MPKAAEPRTSPTSEYSAQELAESASLFGVAPECVTAALRGAGLEKATKQQAREIIQKFMGKAVK